MLIFQAPFSEVFPSTDYYSFKELPVTERNVSSTRSWSPVRCI